MTLQGAEHLVDQIVDVQKLQLHGGVADRDGQVVGHVVAEGGHRAVVVGAAPLAEEVREAVDVNRCARLLSITKEKILARLLTAAVVAVVAADESGLDGGGQHHGAGVPVLFQRLQKGGAEPEIPRHELGGILGAVDPRQMEDEIRLLAIPVQEGRIRVQIVQIQLPNGEGGMGAVLPLGDIFEGGGEVLPHEAPGAGNEYVHLTSPTWPARPECRRERRSLPWSLPRSTAWYCWS